MPDFLKKISNKITEYWNKFSKVQKVQIIAVSVIGIVALVILTLVLSRPNMILYADEVSPEKMNIMVETLTENNIQYRYEDNATKLYVESGKFQEVQLLLAEKGVLSGGKFEWNDALNTSITTTAEDRTMMKQLAFENELASIISLIDGVDSAVVKIVAPESGSVIFEQDKKATASIFLTTLGKLTDEQIYGIASFVETSVENLSINDIKILDSTSKLLFNGGGDDGLIGNLNSNLEYKEAYEVKYERTIENLLLSRGEYDDAVVGVNLKIDFDSIQSQSEVYSIPEDASEPLPTHIYIYDSSGATNAAGGQPGTDSNANATTYVTEGAGGTESEVSITEKDYTPNMTVTTTVKSIGEIVKEDSTVTVKLSKYIYHNQVLIEEQGLLDETSWEQYKIDNGERTSVEVDPDLIRLVSNASNIESVFIMASEVPVFVDREVKESNIAGYIPVIVIVLMIALLGYAIYKGTEPVEITEVEPELSVEAMLETTNTEEELEAIEFGDKSDARVQIERFVDENPEAVAQLLRNWLNEDWE